MAVDTNCEGFFDEPCKLHNWGTWKVIEYTGDWFHPVVIQRTCSDCGAEETDEP